MAKKIDIDPGADPSAVMAVVARVADDEGYLFERHDDLSATAHEGGKRVSGKVTATRARLGIEIDRDRIKVKAESNGVAYAANNVPFFTVRIAQKQSRFAKRLKAAVAQAGLA